MFLIVVLGCTVAYLLFNRVKELSNVRVWLIGLLVIFITWFVFQLYTGYSFSFNIIDLLFYIAAVFTITTYLLFLFAGLKPWINTIVRAITPIAFLFAFAQIPFEKRQVVGLGLTDNTIAKEEYLIKVNWFITGFHDQGTLLIFYPKEGLLEQPSMYYRESLHGIGRHIQDVKLTSAHDSLTLVFDEEYHLSDNYSKVELRKVDFW